jgi:hypothetical protein
MRRLQSLLSVLMLLQGICTGARGADFASPFRFERSAQAAQPQASPVRGALRLAGTAPDGDPVHGLSGLVWQAAEGLLHAVSDQGYLLTLRPGFAHDELVALEFVSRHPLRDAAGKQLEGPDRDAEGLALDGEVGHETLLVSFEHRHRVARHDLNGRWLEDITPAAPLAAGIRALPSNDGMEALTVHPGHGVLVGIEHPAEALPGQILRFTDPAEGWIYPVASPEGALVALDTLADGRLLALERRFIAPWKPLIITLRLLNPDAPTLPSPILARFSSAEGWPVDNFEALAWHRDDRVFMLSDDNANPAQETLLVYLQLPLH